jgi:hypothetical protein
VVRVPAGRGARQELDGSALCRPFGRRALAFLAHPTLGRNYRQIVRAVHRQVVERGNTIQRLFGAPDDSKLVSSLTLFGSVSDATDGVLRTQVDEILTAAAEQGSVVALSRRRSSTRRPDADTRASHRSPQGVAGSLIVQRYSTPLSV